MKVKTIFAVIITYNPSIELLDAEYNSIAPQVERIIYVDNFSKNREDIKQWMHNRQPAEVIWLEENEGIGIAQNAGIQAALQCGATHIIIFDQDSVVSPDFVQNLYCAEQQALSDGINVGLTGPVYYSPDGKYAYPILNIGNNKMQRLPLKDMTGDYMEVSHIIASGELIRRETIEKAGLMKETWFIGYIDFEYCFRAAQYGFSTIVTKNATMYHQMGDRQVKILGRKIGIYSPFRRYFDCRNTILIQKDKILPKCLCHYYLKLLAGKVLISFIFGPSRLLQFKYCLNGLVDGLKGKTGKCPL